MILRTSLHRRTGRGDRSIGRLAQGASQRGQAIVEYIVGTLFVVLLVAFLADPSLFGVTRDILASVKGYFKAFAYAMSVAAT